MRFSRCFLLVPLLFSHLALGGPIPKRQVTFCSDKPAVSVLTGYNNPFRIAPSQQVPFDYKAVSLHIASPDDSQIAGPSNLSSPIDAIGKAANPPKYCYIVTADIEPNGGVRFYGVIMQIGFTL